MKLNQLLVLSAASVLIGGGGFAFTSKALADQFSLVAQNSSPSTEQRERGEGRPGLKFERLTGLTDAQKNQIRQINEASRQQIGAIPTAEQKAKMQAIRNDAKSKMDAVLTAEQRQQLEQSSPSGEERRGPGFARLSGLTDAQKNRMREIRSASRQQMDTVLTSEQKAKMQAIRNDAKSKMNAVLTAEQRQQLEQLRQQKRQDRQQQQS